MRRLSGPFLAAALFALLVPPRKIAAQAFPRPSPRPRLEADSRAYAYGEKLNVARPRWQDVLDAALWASGWDGGGSRNLLVRGIDELLADPGLPRGARERGEYILEFMHRRFLRRYAERQTRLDVLAESGGFNCVSSAVLYAVLARAASLELRGVITRDHAFITLDAGDERIDIETTNSFGFDPGSRREFHDRFGRTTGFAYVPARDYRERNDLSILELVSVILSNRIAEAELSLRFYEGPGLALDRAALLSGRERPLDSPFFIAPEEDVKTRLLNYGALLVRQGREEDALAWEDAAFHLAPDAGLWEEFVFACLNNLLVKSVRAGNAAGARLLLDENRGRLSGGNYARLDLLVSDAEMVELSTAVRGPGETGAVLAALASANLEPARFVELREFVILTEGNRIAADQDWRAAIAWLEEALERFGPSARISGALGVYRSNRAADLHNGFAGLYNKRDYAAAREWIQRALAEFPDNRQLVSDSELVEQALHR